MDKHSDGIIYKIVSTAPYRKLLNAQQRIQCELRGNESARQKLLEAHKPSAGHAPHSSKAPLDSLKRITISELSTNTVHRGRVLVCRTVSDPINFGAVQILIEDPVIGQDSKLPSITRLSLYNFKSTDASSILPLGTRLFIKEPYYKAVQGGDPMVLCNSPDDVIVVPKEQVDGSLLAGLGWSDILWLLAEPTTTPTIKYSSNSADILKQRGNEQFARKDYSSAIDIYTQALKLDPRNVVLLSNRAQAHLHLESFRQALEDAQEALNIDGANTKALFRQAKALYGLRSYEKALQVLNTLKTTNTEIQELHQRTEQRLKEQQHGQYDITSIIQEAQLTKPPYLNHADYVGPVRVTEIPGKGRGLVATEDVAEGTLLLCSKAFAVLFCNQFPAVEVSSLASSPNLNPSDIVISLLQLKLSHKLKKEPWTASEFYNLYAGSPITDNRIDTEDARINMRILNIIKANAFSPNAYDGDLWSRCSKTDIPAEDSLSGLGSSNVLGVWTFPSYMNHSCLANANFVSIGDLLFVRAIRDIAEGEEVCVSYTASYKRFNEREKFLQPRDFKCQCLLCEFEQSHPEATRRRHRLLEEFDGIRNAFDIAMIPRLKRIVDELRKTYQAASTNTTNPQRGKNKKKKKAITASTSATSVTASTSASSVFHPHQLKFAMIIPLFSLSELLNANNQLRESIQVLAEVLEIPRTGGSAYMNILAVETIWKVCKLGNLAEEDRYLQLLRKEYMVCFGGCNDKSINDVAE